MFKEFKEFAVKGNVIDMAVGIIIGAAFGKIVSSFVNDILMPPIGLLLGKVISPAFFSIYRANLMTAWLAQRQQGPPPSTTACF